MSAVPTDSNDIYQEGISLSTYTLPLVHMNFPNLTRFFVARRAGPSTEGDRNDSPNLLHTGRGDTWVDNFTRGLNVASALSATFPPLKAATEALNVILKDLQVCHSYISFTSLIYHMSRTRKPATIQQAFKA